MKIAVCAHDYLNYVSGPNVWLLRFIREMKKDDIEVVVLFMRGGEGKAYRYVNEVRNMSCSCYIYNGSSYTEDKIKWMLGILNIENPDIFIPNYDLPAYYAARWAREAGIPTIGILRSDDKVYMAILDQFISSVGPFNPSAIVCVSKYLEKLTISKNNGNTHIVKRIPSGTPIPEIVTQKPEGILKLIYTGRIIEEQKRISEMTSILCRTIREVPGTEAVIYGSGNALDSVLNILSIEGKDLPVHYGGVIDSGDVHNVISEGHVFVLLSDYEGVPTSVMEAMACGLVPVCLNIRSGIPELVEHEKTGLLVRDRGDDFIRSIRRLKNEDGLWEKLSAGARKKVEVEYSINNSIQKWKNLLQELLVNRQIEKKKLKIPRRFDLPHSHQNIKHADMRWPGSFKYYGSKAKRLVKRLYH